MNKFQDITIKHMDNGLKVTVGCVRLVYQQKDIKQFFKDLESYLNDPEKTEKIIRKRWDLRKPEPLTTTTEYTVYWGLDNRQILDSSRAISFGNENLGTK